MAIKAIVVDDELLARQRITDLLANEPDITVVAECANGAEAIKAIIAWQPDLLFLDVQMPELGGFEVLRELKNGRLTANVVFVTAYDQYALRAFDVHALDYLLKPFDKARFQQTLQRVREQQTVQQQHALHERLATFINHLNKPYPSRLTIRSQGRIYFVTVANIAWIEAAGNHIKLYEEQANHLLRQTMKETEALLDPQQFLRIHRSLIVNVSFIQELQPWGRGEYVIILHDGTRLHASRSHRPKIEAFLNSSL